MTLPATAQRSYWHDVLVAGCLTLLHGAPKDGKSSLLAAILGAILQGESLFGHATARTGVVYVSEETPAVYRGKAARVVGGAAAAGLRPAGWWQRWRERRSWYRWWHYQVRGVRQLWHVSLPDLGIVPSLAALPSLCAAVQQLARETGAGIIVWDTLKAVAPEALTANQHAERLIGLMKALAGAGPAGGYSVVIVHHDNDDGKPLGPKALYGGVDFALHQSRLPNVTDEQDTRRRVVFTGRFPTLPPDPLIYRMQEDGTLALEIGRAHV